MVEFLLTLGGEEREIKYVCLKKPPKQKPQRTKPNNCFGDGIEGREHGRK